MDALGIPYSVNEEDGAFYGPELDFLLPQRFEANRTVSVRWRDADDGKHFRCSNKRKLSGENIHAERRWRYNDE